MRSTDCNKIPKNVSMFRWFVPLLEQSHWNKVMDIETMTELAPMFLVADLTENTLIVIAFERPISHFFPGCEIVTARIDAIIFAPTR